MLEKPLVVHPFLFAIFPTLFLFAHNIGELSLNVIFVPMVFTVGLTLIYFLLLSLVLKDMQKAGIIVSLFLLLFFSFGHFLQALNSTGFRFIAGWFFIQNSKILLFLWSAFFFVGAYFSIKTYRSLGNFTYLLNIIASFLIVTSLANIGIYKLRAKTDWKEIRNEERVEIKPGDLEMVERLPNIYYIILDGYARADILKEIYEYENTEFYDYLTKKGFYIADKSMSNYSQTSLSLAACLNLKYLDNLADKLNIAISDLSPLKDMIKNSWVFDFLRQYGYKIVAFSSGYPGTEIDNADLYVKTERSLNEFQNELLNTTYVPEVLDMVKSYDRSDAHRKKILFTLENLGETRKMDPPIFVFAHVKAPHPPFVFGPDGEKIKLMKRFTDHDGDRLIRKDRLTREQYLKGYRDQLIFINKKVIKALNQILSDSKNPPIIILQADHGPRSMLVWESKNRIYFRECMTILNAYHLPDNGSTHLYEDITPVNTFRVIFNHYFGTDYHLLEDKSYYSSARRAYEFRDVTDKIKTEELEDFLNRVTLPE